MRQVLTLTNISWLKKKTDKEKDQSVKVPNDHAFQWSTHFLNGFFSLPRKAQLKMHLKRVP